MQDSSQLFTTTPNGTDLETGVVKAKVFRRQSNRWCRFLSPIFLQALTMTFLAEWGDRSQIATIILAAREVSHI